MKFKQAVKSLAAFLLPSALYLELTSAMARKRSQVLLREWGCPQVNRKVLAHFGDRVVGGPFAGMVLAVNPDDEQLGPYLLGTYEREITPWLESVKGEAFPEVLDVGSKFGYYAVGFATWFPKAVVRAFDTDTWARKATQKLADANGVRNLKVHGLCSPQWLKEHLKPGSFILSDCEGYEFVLLDPDAVPALKTATILVESHDAPPWEKHQGLIAKFSPTHTVEEVDFDTGDRSIGQDLDFLNEHEKGLAVGEARLTYQKWLFFRPRA